MIPRNKIAYKITQMISQLHKQNYESVYIYSGMSANGMNWRYEIGIHNNGQWPVEEPILEESISHNGEIPWAKNTDSIEKMAQLFISKYLSKIKASLAANYDYCSWYQSIVSTIDYSNPLVFYADYDAMHKEFLNTAPGYALIP